jgi:hypothetical protein
VIVSMSSGFVWIRIESAVGFCERGNGSSISIRFVKFLD